MMKVVLTLQRIYLLCHMTLTLNWIADESSRDRNSLTLNTLEKQDQSSRRKLEGCLDGTKIMEPCRSWTDNNGSTDSEVDAGSLSPGDIASLDDDEDDTVVMNNDLAPGPDLKMSHSGNFTVVTKLYISGHASLCQQVVHFLRELVLQ